MIQFPRQVAKILTEVSAEPVRTLRNAALEKKRIKNSSINKCLKTSVYLTEGIKAPNFPTKASSTIGHSYEKCPIGINAVMMQTVPPNK